MFTPGVVNLEGGGCENVKLVNVYSNIVLGSNHRFISYRQWRQLVAGRET
jgi:hypothetical protein